MCFGVMGDIRPDLTDAEFAAQMPEAELRVHIEGTIEPVTKLEGALAAFADASAIGESTG